MKLYNTLTKSKEEFVPLEEGKVKMYVCGPTVYNFIHIGNARPMIVFDTVRRYLEYKGYEVNFSEEDLGKNKAVALAASAQEVFGIDVKAYPEYLTPDNMLRYLSPDSYSSSSNIRIIIGAVDNHACRKLLHEYFQHPQYLSENVLYYIDSANEFSCGEIVIGKRTYRDIAAPDRVHYYPDIMQDNGKAAYEMSCEELNSSAPQHLATNGLAADLIFSYLSQLLMAGEQAPLAPGGIIYFDALKLFSRFDIYEEVRHGKIVK